jgi:hypothetical protein
MSAFADLALERYLERYLSEMLAADVARASTTPC